MPVIERFQEKNRIPGRILEITGILPEARVQKLFWGLYPKIHFTLGEVDIFKRIFQAPDSACSIE